MIFGSIGLNWLQIASLHGCLTFHITNDKLFPTIRSMLTIQTHFPLFESSNSKSCLSLAVLAIDLRLIVSQDPRSTKREAGGKLKNRMGVPALDFFRISPASHFLLFGIDPWLEHRSIAVKKDRRGQDCGRCSI